MSVEDGINSGLVIIIPDRVIVKKKSTKEENYRDIFLKLGAQFEAVCCPNAASERVNHARKDKHADTFCEAVTQL